MNEFQQCPATVEAVAPGGIEVTRIPRVCHVVRTVGIIQQQVYLAVRVAATHALHVAQVIAIHAYQQVIMVIITARQLTRRFSFARYAVLSQFAACRWINGVAQFLGARGGRCYLKTVCQTSISHKAFHYKLGHRTAADVAVAHKKYLMFFLHL